jgi:hypothetical protein
MRSLFTNLRKYLCVNIFHNGEFVQSRIVPIEAAQKVPEDLHHNYAGCREDNVLEVLPYSDIEDSPMVDGTLSI